MTRRKPSPVTLGFDGTHEGEPIAVVTDSDGVVHYASAGSKFVVEGLEKGTVSLVKVEAPAGDDGAPAS